MLLGQKVPAPIPVDAQDGTLGTCWDGLEGPEHLILGMPKKEQMVLVVLDQRVLGTYPRGCPRGSRG